MYVRGAADEATDYSSESSWWMMIATEKTLAVKTPGSSGDSEDPQTRKVIGGEVLN